MSNRSHSIDEVVEELRIAIESQDLAAFSDLLDPNVTWGAPGASSPTCRSKSQVLTWYERGQSSGASARVIEVVTEGDRVLVGLIVSGVKSARDEGGHTERWQVFTLRDGHIADIVGFDQRIEAAAWLGVG